MSKPLDEPAGAIAGRGRKQQGHGHGMSRNRTPKGDNLPHDSGRDDKQPYAREVEEYGGDGPASAPEENTGERGARDRSSR